MRLTRLFRMGVKRPKILPASGRSGLVALDVSRVLAILRDLP
jgi:hypothetical protein